MINPSNLSVKPDQVQSDGGKQMSALGRGESGMRQSLVLACVDDESRGPFHSGAMKLLRSAVNWDEDE